MLMDDASRRLRRALGQVRWAFRTTRACCPRLLAGYGINALVLTLVPAGLALSVRGLVNAVDRALDGVSLADTGAYPWLVVGFVMTLVASLGTVVGRHLAQRMQLGLRRALRRRLLLRTAATPFAHIEQPAFQDDLRRVQDNPELHVADLCTHSVELATKSIQGLSLLLILVAIEPLLFLFLLPIGVPYIWYRSRLSKRQFLELDQRVEQERWMAYYARILADADQAAELRLLGIGDEVIRRWQTHVDEIEGLRCKHQREELIAGMAFGLGSVLAVYLAMAHAIGAIVAGQLSIGDLAIFASAAAQLRGIVDQAATLVGGLRWNVMHVGRLSGFLAAWPAPRSIAIDPPAPAPAPAPAPTEPRSSIELRAVSFRYPGAAEPLLRELSLRIDAGETVALVGANGAGKTTVAKLIAGLYQPEAGAVLIDGQDTATWKPGSLGRRVGCVFQQFGRYQASAFDNIAFGDWPRLCDDRAAVESVARKADVHGLIASMPQGYDTMLGRQFGHYQPSGGQWQQLAIARLIARDAPILILDEPTANLDVTAEAELFRRFRSLAAGRTALLISHRFSTVAMADRILVMDQGQIVEEGSHRELMERGGRYTTLFRLAQRFAAEVDR
jgi:ABC-type multidrug transport system fused ATPase/permease subunit